MILFKWWRKIFGDHSAEKASTSSAPTTVEQHELPRLIPPALPTVEKNELPAPIPSTPPTVERRNIPALFQISQARQQIVVVGLDFGTSSTKVVYREIESKGRPAHAIDFGVQIPGYCRFAFPSTVAREGNRLLYGIEAERCAGSASDIHRSFKVRLLKGQGLHPMATLLPDFENPAFLSSVYLGAVLLNVRNIIKSRIRQPSLFFNMDVPVSALDLSPSKKIFERVLRCAVALSSEPACLLDGRADYLWEMWRTAWNESSPEDEPCEVVPESLAVAFGAGTLLSEDENIYKAIVDIGAGTTDVAWFKILRRVDEDRLPVFASGTEMVGCDDLDEELVRRVKEAHPGFAIGAGEIRTMKAEALDGEAHGKNRYLCRQDIEEAVQSLTWQAYNFYSKMFGQAYRMEPDTSRWEGIQVIVAGGGSRIPALRGRFQTPPRSFVERVDLTQLYHSNELGSEGESRRPATSGEMTFLLPSLGLSFPSVELPKPKLPSQIKTLPRVKKGPTGDYDYEADGYV